ncbi:hypothetical protein GUJ93_ZPchr0656g26852 [Zizania palustris]|uniref:Glycosyl transferase 64 domain-containing protein n=1 Tax=Zizania palustris TaxID=103762 RepID=A0A8J5R5L7_ZIZPA|nr:hypothetical protein GUJ93_ZPchr0656g26852 [Zizania palustris]
MHGMGPHSHPLGCPAASNRSALDWGNDGDRVPSDVLEHYSKCVSVRDIVVIWNNGQPPAQDLERGFKVWREHPDRIIGYYPRLAEGSPLEYRNERYARQQGGYNMVLTGAAFMDHGLAFKRYWSKEAEVGRQIVDSFFNFTPLESKLAILLQEAERGNLLTIKQRIMQPASREKGIPKLQAVKFRTINKQERQACSCNNHGKAAGEPGAVKSTAQTAPSGAIVNDTPLNAII